MNFNVMTDVIEPDRVVRFQILQNEEPLSRRCFLYGLRDNAELRTYFSSLLQHSSFAAFRWETPMVNRQTIDRPQEFVLINTPGFTKRASDQRTFRNFFVDATDDANCGVVAFRNLSGDAMMVVPSPVTGDSQYGHLAAFLRDASADQVDALWRLVGEQMTEHFESQPREPVWLNTAGGGVAWLHVRLDSVPKYYHHREYQFADE